MPDHEAHEGGFVIEHNGVLIRECTLPGETRADGVVPAHPNGTPLSRDRWLIVYATRKFRGTDDDTSIIYQVRADAPDGRLLKEGMLARSIDDWDPTGEGKSVYVMQHGSPVAFGVPRGALVKGKPAASAGVIAIKWRKVAREYDRQKNWLEGYKLDPSLVQKTQVVEWTQVRLNAAGDDIEILQPLLQFRQKGYEDGPHFCSLDDAVWMSQSKNSPVPFSDDLSEWVDVNHFSGHRFAACLHRFNPRAGLYEWVRTGPYLFEDDGVTKAEGPIARWKDSWVVASRTDTVVDHVHILGPGIAWVRVEDPFGKPGATFYSRHPLCGAPVAIYACADGAVRMFSGDGRSSPYKNERDPLYCWDIDPDRGYAPSRPRVVYDTVAAGLPIRREALPKVDMCKVLTHTGGNAQYLLHRVSVTSTVHEHIHTKPVHWVFPPLNDAEKGSCAVYCARIRYDAPYPAWWDFPAERG